MLVALLFQGPIDPTAAAPEAAATRARLELRGAPDCISRNELAARVAARSPRIQFVDGAAIAANVALTSARPGNVVAELVLTAAGIEPAPRRIVARSCAEAADAIALMIAVTLDPTLKRKAATGAGGADTAGGGSAPADAGTPASAPTETPDQPVKEPAPPATVAEIAASSTNWMRADRAATRATNSSRAMQSAAPRSSRRALVDAASGAAPAASIGLWSRSATSRAPLEVIARMVASAACGYGRASGSWSLLPLWPPATAR